MTVLFQGAVGEPEWWATRAIRSPVKRYDSPRGAGTHRGPCPGRTLPGPPTTCSPGHVGPSAADKNIGRAAVKPRAAPRCVRARKPLDAEGSCGQQGGAGWRRGRGGTSGQRECWGDRHQRVIKSGTASSDVTMDEVISSRPDAPRSNRLQGGRTGCTMTNSEAVAGL